MHLFLVLHDGQPIGLFSSLMEAKNSAYWAVSVSSAPRVSASVYAMEVDKTYTLQRVGTYQRNSPNAEEWDFPYVTYRLPERTPVEDFIVALLRGDPDATDAVRDTLARGGS